MSGFLGQGNPIELLEIDDPTAVADTGFLFTDDVAARTELHYLNDNGDKVQITSGTGLNVPAGAPTNAEYVVLTANAVLSDERVLTATASISVSDAGAGLAVTLDVLPAGVDHGGLGGLPDDDHTQYALLAGRSGGQILVGGVDASDPLTFRATANGTDGPIIFQTDPTTERMRILPTGEVQVGGTFGTSFNVAFALQMRGSINDRRGMFIENLNAGNVAKASLHMNSNNTTFECGATSSAFSTVDGLAASQAFVRSNISGGVFNIVQRGTGTIRFTVNSGERMRVIHTNNTLQGNGGMKLEGGAGADTLTLSGGASAASIIAVGIGSELIAFYGVAATARPAAYTQTFATATRTHAARTAPAGGGGSGADGTTFNGAECDALVADQQNTAAVLNQLLDDLQLQGLSQ